MRLQGKTAIITGGARGIGAAIAEGYAREGARVCVADVNFKAAEETAARIGHGSFAVALDVTRLDQVRACVAATEARCGSIDILVNNAAVFDMAPWGEITAESYQAVFDVNVKGLIFMLQEVAESMKRRGTGGKIINFASQAGRRGEALVAVYCASKAADLPHAIRRSGADQAWHQCEWHCAGRRRYADVGPCGRVVLPL